MPTLYQLGSELMAAHALVDETAGELTAELAAYLDQLESDEERKLDGYIGLMRTLEMEAAQCQAEIDQWRAKQQARKNLRERLAERLQDHLKRTGRTRATSAEGRTVAIVKNGGVLPLIVSEAADLHELPEEFVDMVPVLKREAVRAKLEAGETLDFAHLGERGTRLSIK